MNLQVEVKEHNDALRIDIEQAVRDITKLRADVTWVALGSLPNDGKVIEDARSYK